MAAKITTKYGHPVPPAPRHSITFHMPQWENAEKFGTNRAFTIAALYNAYPRMKPHRDIAALSEAVLKHLDLKNSVAYLFSSLRSARECLAYSVSPRRRDAKGKEPIDTEKISLRAFRAKDLFYCVIFPIASINVANGFWTSPGVGVSSRFAEANLECMDQLKEVDFTDKPDRKEIFETPAHQKVRERVVEFLKRSPIQPDSYSQLSSDDVYLYPTGMAAIYRPHLYLSSLFKGTTVLFGMAFFSTPTIFNEYGEGCKWFGHGTEEEIKELEVYLENEQREGRKVQAIWTEFPANPLLVTADLVHLRQLADKYDTILVVDDTLGSFSNLDVLYMSDFLITSLTKSFNGYADVMAGSIVLNPESSKYSDLKPLFDKNYVPELYHTDAETLEKNSRDYLTRSKKLNHNAEAIVQYLQSQADNPESAVMSVHHPSVNASGIHYKKFMRPPTNDFTPGYGCLFSVEFDDLEATKAFYNTLNVHDGPHLGAPFTLAFAYTMCQYGDQLEWAATKGLKPTQIRIAAGLEDTDLLLEEFRIGIEAADEASRKLKAKGAALAMNNDRPEMYSLKRLHSLVQRQAA